MPLACIRFIHEIVYTDVLNNHKACPHTLFSECGRNFNGGWRSVVRELQHFLAETIHLEISYNHTLSNSINKLSIFSSINFGN